MKALRWAASVILWAIAMLWPFALFAVLILFTWPNPYVLAAVCVVSYGVAHCWHKSQHPAVSLFFHAATLGALVLLFFVNWIVALITIPAGVIIAYIIAPIVGAVFITPTVAIFSLAELIMEFNVE